MPSDKQKPARTLMRIGKYEVRKHIATGGMGAVYKAVDSETQRTVAIKILSPELANRPNMLERFHREARSAAKLRHENIVALYDCDEQNGMHFIAMEYVEGIDLQAYITRKQRLKPDEAVYILTQATRALEHAHEQGIVHRDIKPSNFLLTKKDNKLVVKLTDMGLARFVNEDEAKLTRDGTTVGTVDYISPEQARKSDSADIRSDIYSLGCTLFHMLAGVAPFAQGSMPERLLQHLEAPPPDIRQINPHVSKGLARIVNRMLAKSPDDRYQTPAELLADLARPEGKQAKQQRQIKLRDTSDSYVVHESNGQSSDSADVDGDDEDSGDGGGETENVISTLAALADFDEAIEEETDENGEIVISRPMRGKKKNKPSPAGDDDDEHDEAAGETPLRKGKLPLWVPWAAAAVGPLVLVPILIFFMTRSTEKKPSVPPTELTTLRPVVPQPNPGPDPGPVVEPKKVEPVIPNVPNVPEKNTSIVQGPAFLELAKLYEPAETVDLPALRKDWLTPFGSSLAPMQQHVIGVSRTGTSPAGTTYDSIASALAQAKAGVTTVIEIHDNGPLFERDLPKLVNKHVVLRAGAGYRPLIAWDSQAGDQVFLSVDRGSLTLENVDFAAKWPESAAQRAVLFQVRAREFAARSCTFAVAGSNPEGIAIVQALAPMAAPPLGVFEPDTSKLIFDRSCLRGGSLMAANIVKTSADVLIHECLVVGGNPPLIQIEGDDSNNVSLRLLQSTLVCGQNAVRLQGSDRNQAARLDCSLLDTVLSRSDFLSAEADLLQLGDGVPLERVSWRPVNTLYAGWVNLLRSPQKTITAMSMSNWQKQWNHIEGDRAVVETWPRKHTRVPEEVALDFFAPWDSLAYAGTRKGYAVGHVAGKLPPLPANWLKRTFDWQVPPLVSLPGREIPPIPPGDGRHYQGEVIDLSKVDLGQLLADRLKKYRPGPRVVLHLRGSGEVPTSPIRVQGVDELVLCALQPRGSKARPLVLVPRIVGDHPALFDVDKAHLKLVDIHVKEENRRSALTPRFVFRVKNGKLSMAGCRIIAPLGQAPPVYQGVIQFENNVARGQPAEQSLALRDCVVASAKKLIWLTGNDLMCRANNCVFLAIDDGLQIDAAPAQGDTTRIDCMLENCTFSVRGTCLQASGDVNVGQGNIPGRDQVLVQARNNYFVDPFSEAPHQGRMLRIGPTLLTSGVFRWQGQGNAYDGKRLAGFYAIAGSEKNGSTGSTLTSWQRLLGSPSVRDAVLVQRDINARTDFSIDSPRFSKLTFPPAATSLSRYPGANLERLAHILNDER